MSSTRDEAIQKIYNEVLALKSSPLYDYRTINKYMPVIGEGNLHAKIMFVGEAPGLNEAKTGKPFCGAAGRVFDELLNSVGLKREEIYITNIVKDRPQDNRDPTPKEIELYAPFLDQQIDIIRPRVIATLGRFSMAYIMNRLKLESELDTISKIHGKKFTAKTSWGHVTIIPLFHPASALYQASKKPTLIADFKIMKDIAFV